MGFLDEIIHRLSGQAPQPVRKMAPANHVDNTARMLSAGVSAPIAQKPIQGGNLSARLIQQGGTDGDVIDNRGVQSAMPLNPRGMGFRQIIEHGYVPSGVFNGRTGEFFRPDDYIPNEGQWNKF